MNGDQPWWTKFFVAVGFPTALAIVLLAAFLGWLPSPMMTQLARMEYQSWQQTMIMRAVCYSLARAGGESRNNCEPWKPQE